MPLPDDLRSLLHQNRSLVLSLKITPKSPKSEWAGSLDDGTIKIRIAAPPEKGKANLELLRFLAAELHLPQSHIHILSGASSPRKQIRLSL